MRAGSIEDVARERFGYGGLRPGQGEAVVDGRDVSDSVDSYYQEIGRAGRDGDGAEAVLFYHPEDLGLRRFFAGGGKPDVEAATEIVGTLRRLDRPVHPTGLLLATGLGQRRMDAALGVLEEVGAVEILPTGGAALRESEGDPVSLYRRATRDKERHKQFERPRVEMMRGYAELRDCRRGYVLNYFGEGFEGRCGHCDNCEAGVVAGGDEGDGPFSLGSRVAHEKWGEGTVQRYEGEEKMVVLFDEVGYKTMMVALVEEHGLLEPAG